MATTVAEIVPTKGIPMVEDLTGFEGGRWMVWTVGSGHLFDLGAGTVTRIPGQHARASFNDRPRPLIEIRHCTVGQRGYWLMEPDADEASVEHYWHLSSTIQSIERVPDDDAGVADAGVADADDAHSGFFVRRDAEE